MTQDSSAEWSTAADAAPEGEQAGRTLAQVFLEQIAAAEEEGDFSRVDFYNGDPSALEPEEITADVLARAIYCTNYGSIGDGTSVWILAAFPDGSAVDVRQGELEPDPSLYRLPEGDQDLAEAIVSWCDILAPLAALELEPLDPNRTLSSEERAVWTEAMSRSASHITLSRRKELRDCLREAFMQNPVYARIKAALAAPTLRDGQLLLGCVEFLEVSPNELCLGDWETLEA